MENLGFDIVLLIVLLLLSAFFSASETAITAVSRIKVKKLLEQNVPGAKVLQVFKDDPSRMLATVLICNTIVNIFASVFAASLAFKFFQGVGPDGINFAIGVVTCVMTFLILVFGEISPKTIAIRHAEKIAPVVVYPVLFLELVLSPIAFVLMLVAKPIIFVFGGFQAKGPILTTEEIKMILSMGEKEGVIEEEERKMISSIFEFGKTTVREVMTPSPDMQCVELNNDLDDTVKLIVDGGHSRIPVYDGNIDNIVGVIYGKDLLRSQLRNKEVKDVMHPVLFIPESKKVDELLHQMQAARAHIAIVVDEYGTTAGLVTLEDLIEEIVGEIHDEFEREYKSVDVLNEKSALIDAKMNVADVNDSLKTALPEKGHDTVAGFVLEQLGKVPAVGDTIKYDNVVISVERIHRRRITRLKITKIDRPIDSDIVGG
ncbi:MAG: hemolysin family protein [Candidatus Saganbacteria bacterium]|nr:hemolysin family protein [Candidatus Saganbacteria bacterium]